MAASVRLPTEERANLEASTAPFNSERGVEILFDGVTRGLAQSRDTSNESSSSFHLIYIAAAKASSEPSKKQINWQGPIALEGLTVL